MRDNVRALYYPDFWLSHHTFVKSILLFDEVHIMDRPSMTFDGQSLTIGMASPMRQYEQSLRDQGVSVYVHEPPSGPISDELRAVAEADLADLNYMQCFQDGLRTSSHFRDVNISPGNYGNNETHETISEKLAAIDLKKAAPVLEVHKNRTLRPFDLSTPDGSLKTLANIAGFSAAKMNSALQIGATEGFSPLADMAPYSNLLSAKYVRATASSAATGARVVNSTDLSLAILNELVPPEILRTMSLRDAIKYRKESQSARETFLVTLLALQTKFGQVTAEQDYAATVSKIIASEVRPAATLFRNKLDSIWEHHLGKLAGAAAIAVGSQATISSSAT
jgi:hypothetical protein